jgi:NAD(P)-dependent dehydrogenase (short-subunit alcohol dehydrogenase family)
VTAAPGERARVVVVTGASSGIGRATARAFARQGAALVLAARSPAGLAEVEKECIKDGAETLTVPTDVADASAVDALFDAAVARFGRVDVVVSSAAVVAYGEVSEIPVEVFDRVISTNVTGTVNIARTAIDRFRRQGGGDLVLVGSLLGKIAVPYMGPYVTSKWAIHGLARVLQLETRRLPNINVSLVWPGSVNTPAYLQAANYTGWQGRPPPPIDPPEKVARAVLRAADKPRREASVGIANPVVVLGFRTMPALYDALVTPLMRVSGLSWRRISAHTGNVFDPQPPGDAEHGPWGRLGLRSDGPPRHGDQERSEMTDPWNLAGSAVVKHRMAAPPRAVWAVLSDGWVYATWVVGASRVRAVDQSWPDDGSQVHHSFGLWPAVISDTTEVLHANPDHELVLKARGWPAGEAHIRVVLTPDGDGTEVSIEEDAVAGPGSLMPQPARQVLIAPRNREALRRLAFLVEGRYSEEQGRHHGRQER